MKIVIAPDSYKESLTAMEVATAIEAGFKQVLPNAEYIKLPMADGGEGTVQSLIDATGGSIIEHTVTAPLGESNWVLWITWRWPNRNYRNGCGIRLTPC